MRQLLPVPVDEIDPFALHASIDRPPPPGRPWMLANFVATVDGAIAHEGRSGGISGPADRRVFRALRGIADAIVVGAGTARAEGYGPARPSEEVRRSRTDAGRPPVPPIVVVTRRLALDFSAPLFTEAEAGARTIVVTCHGHDVEIRDRAAEAADLIQVGAVEVDLDAALAALAERGIRVALCEGGPTLLGQLTAGRLLDELCLTRAPLLAGGSDPGLLGGVRLGDEPRPLRLSHLLEEDGTLFARYLAGG